MYIAFFRHLLIIRRQLAEGRTCLISQGAIQYVACVAPWQHNQSAYDYEHHSPSRIAKHFDRNYSHDEEYHAHKKEQHCCDCCAFSLLQFGILQEVAEPLLHSRGFDTAR